MPVTSSNNLKSPMNYKREGKSKRIWIAVGSILGLLIIGYLVYAYVATNVITDQCNSMNNYCKGVFPFVKDSSELNTPSVPSTKKHDSESTTKKQHTKITPVEKPIIYLYPEQETEVAVTLGHPEKLLASYPLYDGGWNVLARPDGTLTDLKTGRELYSLYWEGKEYDNRMIDDGFVVRGSETAGFLEEKLAILGLNERETEEFIVYWLPKLQENNYNYVRFLSQDEINEYMPLYVSPTPDTMIRVMMSVRPLDNPINIHEQDLGPTPVRDGFTVVEWGGSISDMVK